MYTINLHNTKYYLDINNGTLKHNIAKPINLNKDNVNIKKRVYLKLNNLCNIKCTYCFQRQEENFTVKYSISDFEYIIKQLLDDDECEIVIFGGEPFISENIKKLNYIFSLCSDNNKILFYTNASYTSYFNEYLKLNKQHIELLVVTIDGPEYIHNNRRISNGNGYRTILK